MSTDATMPASCDSAEKRDGDDVMSIDNLSEFDSATHENRGKETETDMDIDGVHEHEATLMELDLSDRTDCMEITSIKGDDELPLGSLKNIHLKNFMIHSDIEVDLSNNSIHAILGENGSGKSSLVLSLQLLLGRTVSDTKRGNTQGQVIKYEMSEAIIKVTFVNSREGYKYDEYGDEITVTRVIRQTGKSTYKMSGRAHGREKTCKLQDVNEMMAKFNIPKVGQTPVLNQEDAKTFMSGTDQGKMYRAVEGGTELKACLSYLTEAETMLKEVQSKLDTTTKDSEKLDKKKNELEAELLESAEFAPGATTKRDGAEIRRVQNQIEVLRKKLRAAKREKKNNDWKKYNSILHLYQACSKKCCPNDEDTCKTVLAFLLDHYRVEEDCQPSILVFIDDEPLCELFKKEVESLGQLPLRIEGEFNKGGGISNSPAGTAVPVLSVPDGEMKGRIGVGTDSELFNIIEHQNDVGRYRFHPTAAPIDKLIVYHDGRPKRCEIMNDGAFVSVTIGKPLPLPCTPLPKDKLVASVNDSNKKEISKLEGELQRLGQNLKSLESNSHERHAADREHPVRTRDKGVIQSNINETTAKLLGLRGKITEMKETINKYSKDIKERREKRLVLERKFNHELEELFNGNLEPIGAEGQIHLNSEKEELQLTVKTAKGNSAGWKHAGSLSGGENAFVTLAFLLAIGEQLNCPFQILDEIDVFSDPEISKQMWGLIVSAAKKGRQIIVVTLQKAIVPDAKENGITVHHMMHLQESRRIRATAPV